MEAEGHFLEVLEMTWEGQRQIILESDKLEYKKKAKARVGEKIPYEVTPGILDELEKYPTDTRFLYGYTLCLKHTTTIVGKLRSVFSVDAAHMKGELGGTAFGTWGQDANRNIVCVAFSVFFDNEGHYTWEMHLSTVRRWYPELDDDGKTFIADGDKGFSSAFVESFTTAHKFLCSKHKGENLVKNGGKGDLAIYIQALHARTPEELERLKTQYSEKGRKYMAKTPDKELYLCMTKGRTCGKTTSQVAESANNTLIRMLGENPAAGLLLFIEQETRRVLQNKEMAVAHVASHPLPPNVQEVLSKLRDDRERNLFCGKVANVKLFVNGWAKVSSTKNPLLSYKVGPDPLSCECKESAVTTSPCLHELERCIAKKGSPGTIFHLKDLSTTWKWQYTDLPVNLFSELNVYKYNLGVHVMSVAKKNPRGRPKLNKRHKGKIEIMMSNNTKKSKTA